MDVLKDGLSHKETITQKKPQKTNETLQRPQPMTEKADAMGRKGNFKIKR